VNKEEPYRDQAERLKKRIQKINDKVEDGNRDKLPPREQVHRQKKKKTKWKLKYPVIRLLVLSFILLPIIIFSVISYRDNGKKKSMTQKRLLGVQLDTKQSILKRHVKKTKTFLMTKKIPIRRTMI